MLNRERNNRRLACSLNDSSSIRFISLEISQYLLNLRKFPVKRMYPKVFWFVCRGFFKLAGKFIDNEKEEKLSGVAFNSLNGGNRWIEIRVRDISFDL